MLNEYIPASIVVVDDDTAFLDVAAEFLSEEGHRVRTCAESAQALQLIQEDVPDLVILDVRMPHLGGFGLLYYLSADARTRDIPVLICSALPPGEVAAWAGLFPAIQVTSLPKPDDWPTFVAHVGQQLAAR